MEQKILECVFLFRHEAALQETDQSKDTAKDERKPHDRYGGHLVQPRRISKRIRLLVEHLLGHLLKGGIGENSPPHENDKRTRRSGFG